MLRIAGIVFVVCTCGVAIAAKTSATKAADQTSSTARRATTEPWADESPQQIAAETAALKEEMPRRLDKVGLKAPLVAETKYFLLFSDLPIKDGAQFGALLDRMYARLAEIFNVKPGKNIWHGKASIICFSKREDYVTFEKETYHHDASNSGGTCHPMADGRVEVDFYSVPNDMRFAHTLVHETTHGFMHRYRTAVHLPGWANEGIAEAIAYDLVPSVALRQKAESNARTTLKQPGAMNEFFTAARIENAQYPIAYTLTAFMIHQNKKGYVAFVDAIKDGMPWRESLEKNYGVSLDRLVAAYGNSMGVAGLRAGKNE